MFCVDVGPALCAMHAIGAAPRSRVVYLGVAMKCSNCGFDIPNNETVCPKCGNTVIDLGKAATDISSSDLVALLEAGLGSSLSFVAPEPEPEVIEVVEADDTEAAGDAFAAFAARTRPDMPVDAQVVSIDEAIQDGSVSVEDIEDVDVAEALVTQAADEAESAEPQAAALAPAPDAAPSIQIDFSALDAMKEAISAGNVAAASAIADAATGGSAADKLKESLAASMAAAKAEEAAAAKEAPAASAKPEPVAKEEPAAKADEPAATKTGDDAGAKADAKADEEKNPEPEKAPKKNVYSTSDEPPKKKMTWLWALLALAAVAVAAFFGISGYMQHQAEEQARTAVHQVVVPVSITGLDSNGSRIAVHVTGTDNEGGSVDEVQFINAQGESLTLQKGSYELRVEASPVAGDGTMYTLPTSRVTFIIPEDAGTAATYEPEFVGTLSFSEIDPLEMNSTMIDKAIEALRADEQSADKANALREAATKLNETAVEEKRQADIQAAIDEFYANTEGWQRFEGNLNVMTGREIFEKLGLDFDLTFGDNADAMDKSYAIVWFDEIGALEGKNQNGSMDVTQDVDHVCVAGFDGDIDQKWLDLDNHRVIVAVSDVYYPDALEPHASPVARNADGILTYPNGVLEPSSTPTAG